MYPSAQNWSHWHWMHSSEPLGAKRGSSVSSRSVHSFYDDPLAPGDALDCLSSTLLFVFEQGTPFGGICPFPTAVNDFKMPPTIMPPWSHRWACDLSRANQKPPPGFLHLQPESSSQPVGWRKTTGRESQCWVMERGFRAPFQLQF